jgi:hypothetical protein
MFSIEEIIFVITQSAKKNNNINNNNKSGQKIRTGDIVVAVFVYSTATPLTLRHYTPLGMIPLVCGGDRHFQ